MRKGKSMIMIMILLLSMLTVVFTGTQVAAEPGSMKGYWRLDTGIGSIAVDSSDATNDGTLSGGKFGNALEFDGIDDYVDMPDDDSLDITGDLTVEAWIVADVINTYKSIIVKGDAYTEGKINYGLQIQAEQADGTIRFFVWSPGYTWVDSTSQVPADGNWHHVAVTHDSSNNVKIFIDGALSGSGTLALGPISNSPLDIGRHKHATVGTYQYWDGKIDEVRISNIVRYTSSFTPQTSEFISDANTAGLWHFDESVGTTIYDETTNDNDGTRNGANWAGPTWTTGKHGNGLDFDGIDDQVSIPDSNSLDITSQITMEAWIKPSSIYTGGNWQYDDVICGKRHSYYLRIDENGKLAFYAYDVTTTGYVTGSDMTSYVDTWIHVAATYDGSAVKLYINSQLDTSASRTGNIRITANPVRIGWVDYNRYFHGAIDEVRLWDNALSQSEVELAMEGKLEILSQAGIVIYTSSFHGLDVCDTVTIQIVPDDPDVTIRDTTPLAEHRITPKRTDADWEIVANSQTDTTIDVHITAKDARCKTIHLWLYLSTGEHIGINLHLA
jgi:hypothetical protein